MPKYLNEIYSVATVIYEAWKVRAENKPFYLNTDKLAAYPNAREIIDKFDKKYRVVQIVSTPYEDEFENYEGLDATSIAREIGADATPKYRKFINDAALSYGLIINPTFENYYHDLTVEYENSEEPEQALAADSFNIDIKFNDEHAIVTINGKSLKLPYPSQEAMLFAEVHRADGSRITTEWLLDDWEHTNNERLADRSFKDARRRLNTKLHKLCKIRLAVQYENDFFWLNALLCSKDSPDSNLA